MQKLTRTATGQITSITIDGIIYKVKGFLIGNTPKNIGCIETQGETPGISRWFTHKGLTYVLESDL